MKHNYIDQLSRVALAYLLSVFVLLVLRMGSLMPLWLSIVALSCGVWRFYIFRGQLSFPKTLIKSVLVVSLMVVTLFQYRTNLSLDMFVAILLLSFALKLLEVYHKPSAMLLMYLAIFVLMTYFLYEQTLVAAISVLSIVFVVVAACIAIQASENNITLTHLTKPLKLSAWIISLSLPVMALLFLLIPRSSPLWMMPLQTQQAKTGMSETLSPGDISQLTNSSEVAFRATFIGSIPDKKQLYWQGFIFDEFDGRQWKNNCECNYTWEKTSQIGFPQTVTQAQWHYQVLLEPHGNRWLFALPETHIQNDKISTNQDVLFRARRDIVDRTLYEGYVFLKNEIKVLSNAEQKKYLKLPNENNTQAKQLARQWQQSLSGSQQVVNAALELFNQSFTYTLNPPLLGEQSVDDFLFKTRAGFCEHFASAFVFLMRAAGIPARVIAGYQGGEVNPEGNYIIVRQYDAHAWAQVWLEGKGWITVDPTQAVAPERINLGFESVFASSPVFSSGLNLKAYRKFNIINYFRIQLDYLEYNWSKWVLSYNADIQTQLGFSSIEFIIKSVFVVVILLILMLFGLLIKEKIQKQEPRHIRNFRAIAMLYFVWGVERNLAETPVHFAEKVFSHNLPCADYFLRISKKYQDWLCGFSSNREDRNIERALCWLKIKLFFISLKRKWFISDDAL